MLELVGSLDAPIVVVSHLSHLELFCVPGSVLILHPVLRRFGSFHLKLSEAGGESTTNGCWFPRRRGQRWRWWILGELLLMRHVTSLIRSNRRIVVLLVLPLPVIRTVLVVPSIHSRSSFTCRYLSLDRACSVQRNSAAHVPNRTEAPTQHFRKFSFSRTTLSSHRIAYPVAASVAVDF